MQERDWKTIDNKMHELLQPTAYEAKVLFIEIMIHLTKEKKPLLDQTIEKNSKKKIIHSGQDSFL